MFTVNAIRTSLLHYEPWLSCVCAAKLAPVFELFALVFQLLESHMCWPRGSNYPNLDVAADSTDKGVSRHSTIIVGHLDPQSDLSFANSST